MTEVDLRTANTIPPRMLIKSGSVLIVPRKSPTQNDVTSHMADHGQLSLAPEVTLRRTVVKAGRNESVASIARRYKVSADQVAEWNSVGAASVFKLGQQVVLHLPVRASARAPVRAVARQPLRGKPAAKAPIRKAPIQATRRR